MQPPRSLFLIVALLAVAACGSPSAPSAEPMTFSSTVSFGFCRPSSYCTSRLEVTDARAVLTYESRERPPIVQSREVPAAEWRRLVSSLDAERLRALPSRIGCPDCADGGAETLTVAFAGGRSTTVTFEYNQNVAGIEAVVAEMRTIRQSFNPADAGPLSGMDREIQHAHAAGADR